MDTNNFSYVIVNKNRGWRGLAEITVYNASYNTQMKSIFSFSPKVWKDLIEFHSVVLQDNNFYYVIELNHDDCIKKLPKPTQQRSVLIKNVLLQVKETRVHKKSEWAMAESQDRYKIDHFIRNKNNHTTSDWNNIGIRVTPTI